MFEMPQDESEPTDGVDEDHPLQLTLSMKDLVCFGCASEAKCVAVCARCPSSARTDRHDGMYSRFLKSTPELSVEEWVVVLELATMWEMDGLRAFAIISVEPLFKSGSGEHAVRQVRAGLDYRVDGWANIGAKRLITRADPLSTEDIALLDPALMALILKYRQQAVQQERESVIARTRRAPRCVIHNNGRGFEQFVFTCVGCMPRDLVDTRGVFLSPEAHQEFNREAKAVIQRLTKM
jgi:hypothetical protein